MRERVPTAADRGQQPGADRRVEPVQHAFGRRQHQRLELQALRRARLQDAVRGRRQARDAAADHLAYAGRWRAARAQFGLLAQQLVEEERVAARTLAIGRRIARRVVAGEHGRDGLLVEPTQLELHERALAAQVGDRRGRGGA